MKKAINRIFTSFVIGMLSMNYALPIHAQEEIQDENGDRVVEEGIVQEGGEEVVVDEQIITEPSVQEVEQQPEVNTNTITFDGNGATSGLMDLLVVEENSEVNLPENTFESTGASFMGWNTKADGTGTEYEDQSLISVQEDIVLYAQWLKAPSYISCSNISSGVRVSWGYANVSDSAKVCGYTIRRKTGSGSFVQIATDVTGYTFDDAQVDSGKKYTYEVSASNGEVSSPYIIYSPHVYLQEPNVNSIVSDSTGITIQWDAVAGATEYIIYRNNGQWKTIGTTQECSFTDNSGTSGVTYTYHVQATNSNYTSSFNTSGTSAVCKKPPVVSSVVNKENGILVSWNTVTNANSYNVLRKSDGGSYETIATGVTDSFYMDQTVSSGTKYTYTIQAVTNEFTTEYNVTGKSKYCLSVPFITKISNVSNGLKVTWKSVTGAQGYYLYRWNGSSWDKILTTTSTSYIDTMAGIAGATYTYIVKAYYGSTTSTSDYQGMNATRLMAPTLSLLANRPEGILVQWKPVDGAQTYTVLRKTDSTKYVTIATNVSSCDYLDQTVESGEKYTYTVKANNGASVSLYDTTGKSKYFLSVPTISSITNIAGGLKVSWSKVTGATGYYVYKWDGSSWVKLVSTTSLSYSDKKANKNGVTYKYQIRAYYSTTTSSSLYEGESQIRYLAPSLSSCINDVDGIVLTWNAYSNAQSYNVYRKVGKGSYHLVASDVTTTSYFDQDTVSGQTYTYTVKAIVNGVTSSNSTDGISKLRLDVPTIKSISNVDDGLKVVWNEVEGANSYILYRWNGTKWEKVTQVKALKAVDTLAGISGATYTYMVKAYNEGTTSSSNASGVSQVRLTTPSFKSYSFADGSLTIKWTVVDMAQGYRVYVKKSTDSSYSSYTTVTDAAITISANDKDTYNVKVVAFYNNTTSKSVEKTFTNDTTPSKPNWSNSSCYGSGNPLASSKPSCTWYVWGRVKEITGVSLSGRISDWNKGESSTPSAKAIIMWYGKSGSIEHVAYVESYDGINMVFSESNYGPSNETNKYHQATMTPKDYEATYKKYNSNFYRVAYIPYSNYK